MHFKTRKVLCSYYSEVYVSPFMAARIGHKAIIANITIITAGGLNAGYSGYAYVCLKAKPTKQKNPIPVPIRIFFTSGNLRLRQLKRTIAKKKLNAEQISNYVAPRVIASLLSPGAISMYIDSAPNKSIRP